jgi:hypothetical protein
MEFVGRGVLGGGYRTMNIREVDKSIEGEKRQRLPCVLEWECPECGEEKETDFTDRYLSYPTWGEPMEIGIFCFDCNEIEPIKQITITPTASIEVSEKQ